MFTGLTVKGKEYRLRLDTKNLIALEKAINKNPLDIIFSIERGIVPKVSDVLMILHYSLQACQHGMSFDATVELYDSLIADGKNIYDMIAVLTDVFTDCGLIRKHDNMEIAEKNV